MSAKAITDGKGCRWLSGRKQVAAYLDVSIRTAERWKRKFASFPVVDHEGSWRANTCQLDKWVAATARVCCPTCGREVGKPAA